MSNLVWKLVSFGIIISLAQTCRRNIFNIYQFDNGIYLIGKNKTILICLVTERDITVFRETIIDKPSFCTQIHLRNKNTNVPSYIYQLYPVSVLFLFLLHTSIVSCFFVYVFYLFIRISTGLLLAAQ